MTEEPREINSVSDVNMITEAIKVSAKVTETSDCKKVAANKAFADFLGPQKGKP